MPQSTTVLITGTKAGIGKALLEAFVSRPSHTVIAAIRDEPDSVPGKKLASTSFGPGSKIIVAQYDAASGTAADTLVSHLKANYGVQSLDIVIANAGMLRHSSLVKDSNGEDFVEHFRVNTVGPILLYKATTSLLSASKQTPKFIFMSSTIGSNTMMDSYPLPLSAYGISKAAVNYVAGKVHREEDRLVVIPIQPGWVQTAMGARAAEVSGVPASDIPVTIEASVKGVVKIIDNATKEDHSGKFWDQEGNEVPW